MSLRIIRSIYFYCCGFFFPFWPSNNIVRVCFWAFLPRPTYSPFDERPTTQRSEIVRSVSLCDGSWLLLPKMQWLIKWVRCVQCYRWLSRKSTHGIDYRLFVVFRSVLLILTRHSQLHFSHRTQREDKDPWELDIVVKSAHGRIKWEKNICFCRHLQTHTHKKKNCEHFPAAGSKLLNCSLFKSSK